MSALCCHLISKVHKGMASRQEFPFVACWPVQSPCKEIKSKINKGIQPNILWTFILHHLLASPKYTTLWSEDGHNKYPARALHFQLEIPQPTDVHTSYEAAAASVWPRVWCPTNPIIIVHMRRGPLKGYVLFYWRKGCGTKHSIRFIGEWALKTATSHILPSFLPSFLLLTPQPCKIAPSNWDWDWNWVTFWRMAMMEVASSLHRMAGWPSILEWLGKMARQAGGIEQIKCHWQRILPSPFHSKIPNLSSSHPPPPLLVYLLIERKFNGPVQQIMEF